MYRQCPTAQVPLSTGQVALLTAHLSDALAHGHVLLAGDPNARAGIQPWVSKLGPGIPTQLQNIDSTVNVHNHKLMHMCEDTAIVLCTGRVPSDTPAQASFKAGSNTQPSRLDHVLVGAELFHALQTCKGAPVGRFRSPSSSASLMLLPACCCLPSISATCTSNTLASCLEVGWQYTYVHAVQSEPCQVVLADSTAQARAHQHEQATSELHSGDDRMNVTVLPYLMGYVAQDKSRIHGYSLHLIGYRTVFK